MSQAPPLLFRPNSIANVSYALRMLAAIPREAAVPFRNREWIERRRDRRLRRLIQYAQQTVPFYQEWLARAGVQPASVRTADDLSLIPPVTDVDLREDPLRFVSAVVAPQRCHKFRTGGRSGVDKQIYHDPLSLMMNVAWSERQERVFRRFAPGRRGQRQLVINAQVGVTNLVRGVYRNQLSLLRRLGPQRERIDLQLSQAEQIEKINGFCPEVIISYGVFFGEFMERLHAEGVAIHKPKLIVLGGEMLKPEHRRLIEDDFGIPVVMTYQSTESLKIGFECEYRNGYHLHEDLCIVRVLDEQGRQVPDGEVGQVHITNLVNRATVLINYDQNDRGRILHEPCPCGRSLTRLELVEGRRWPLLRRLDGRVVHYADVSRPLKGETTIGAVQVVIDRPNQWKITIVDHRRAYDREWRERAAREIERRVTGPGIRVEIEQQADTEKTESGKWSPIIIRCPGEPPYGGSALVEPDLS